MLLTHLNKEMQIIKHNTTEQIQCGHSDNSHKGQKVHCPKERSCTVPEMTRKRQHFL